MKMTNNEAKQELIRQMLKQVPEMEEDQELKASFIILGQKLLDAFEDFLEQKTAR